MNRLILCSYSIAGIPKFGFLGVGKASLRNSEEISEA